MPDWWNTAKIRAGYGQLGNNTIGVYEFAQTINPYASYGFGGADGTPYTSGSSVINIVDPDIKWEDTESTNVGVDLGMFNNRLQFLS
ncbi:hypothetical protein [Mesoflavibacter sp. CH_XMU1404-2]|uniref:hypothetical protein n=1 Tax=Mesoflavibacter sp. CH_XMU1404-2 TaxID=3107766 RepID=UPI0030089511